MSVHQSPIQDHLDDLRLDIVRNLAYLLLIGTGFAVWWAINKEPFPYLILFYLTTLALMSWLIARLTFYDPNLAKYSMLVGVNLMFMVGLIILPDPHLPFACGIIIFISAILMPYGEVASGLAILATFFYIQEAQNPAFPLTQVSLYLGASIIVAWLLIYTLYTTTEWYGVMYAEVRKLLEETRTQRGNLTQALNSLEISYQTQQRIQQDLIAARKKAEEAQRLKERFAANISHELRTPLNLILGFSEVMHFSPEIYGEVNWTPLLTRDISQIYRSSQHLMEMIDDILDLSYFEQSQFSIRLEAIPFSQFMSETIDLARNLFRNHQQLQFKVHIPPDLPIIEIDRTRIRQVILNLLNNARRFTAEGFVQLAVNLENGHLAVSVQDSGIGIPPEALDHIFDEYYQVDYSLSRKHGGAGLGLAVSKRFIEAHHGKITVTSQVGIGSTFTFTLPVAPDSPTFSPGFLMNAAEKPFPEADACLLFLGSDTHFVKRLQRNLNPHQLIQIDHPEHLPTAIKNHHPRALIMNRPPANDLKLSIPLIECKLFSPLDGEDYISKPITADHLKGLLQKWQPIQSLLIVDDDLGFIQLMQRYMQVIDSSIQVYHAYSGEECLQILESHIPDLVLADMILPDMNGLEVIHQARKIRPSVPMILLTATNYELEHAAEQPQLIVTWSDRAFPDEPLRCINGIVSALRNI